MPKILEAQINAQGIRLAVVASRFNSLIVERLIAGAIDSYLRHGGLEDDLTVIKVPGAFELPLAVKVAAKTGLYDALVALGAVIRGSTPHFEYVAAEVSKGLAQVQLETLIPVSFGVLTCDSAEQAIDRAGVKSGNKGFDAVVSAVETARLLKLIASGGRS
jgi:6,7-dimethyl-8-ribityllumazine synthase